jgi:hypothetical protein
MATIANLKVNLLADSTGLNKSLADATAKMQAFGTKMTDIGQTMSTRLTLPIVAMGGAMVKAFTVQEDAVARMTAALKANGGQAGITSQEIQSMASSLQKVTTFGDEATISASALLLTFHKVRNEMGKGNDIFNRTIKSAQDLASALGIDLQSATMQLAKALENPTIGIGALARSGTTFSEQQKEMIKTLVESGRQLEAQAMILDVVESQYKGTAEAMRQTTSGTIKGSLNELGDEMEAFGQIISQSLIPFVNKLTDIIRQISALDEGTKKLILVISGLVAVVGPALLVIGALTKGVVALGIAFTTATGPIGMMITAIGLLTGAYIIHKMTVTEAESATKALVNMNAGFAQALTANATQMAGFADEAGRTAYELKNVNDAFKVMVAQATARADSLEQSLEGARRELYELERTGKGNILTGFGADSDRAKELRDQIKALSASLNPLYGFLTKASEGMEAFGTATTKATTGTGGALQAVGSINALSAELEGLQAQFEATASGVERVDLAGKIRELEERITVLRSVLKPVVTDLKMLNEMGMAGSDGFSGADWDSQYEGVRIVTSQMALLEAGTAIAQQTALQFTDSFGAGMANVVLQGENLIDVLKNIGKLLLSSAIQTGIKLLLMGTSGFGVAGGTLGLLGGLFNPQVSAVPSAVMGAGTMQMSGSFKLQGTDLIMSVNRSQRQFR